MGWAARSMKYRSAAYGELGALYLTEHNLGLAEQYLEPFPQLRRL